MAYPTIFEEVNPGLKLHIPDPEQVKDVYEAMLAKDPATPFPFWAKLWPSARALTEFLLSEPELVSGMKVLEIGAGIGMPSFAIAHLVHQVIISDHAPEAIELAEQNIERLNLKNITARCLDWNEFPEDDLGELVLMSDVNYSPDQFENLLALIKRLLGKGCTMIIATPQRITATLFVKAIQPFIDRRWQTTIDDQGQTTDVSIFVLSS